MADKIKLTKTTVDKIPFAEKGKQIDYYDTELSAFGIRVSATSKSYFVRKWINGKLSRVTLGRHGVISADTARKQASDATTEIRKGVDVNDEKAKSRVRGITLSDAFDRFLKTRKSLKPRTVEHYKDDIKRNLSSWLQKPIGEITKDMVAKKHIAIAGSSGQATANSVMRTFRAVYNYALSYTDHAIPDNPVQRLSQTRQWYKVERRDTFIKPHELKAWHDAVQGIGNPVIRDYLLLTLFTGLRKQEGLQLKWSNVDMRDRSFTIPPHLTKNGKAHTLPMSKYIHSLFEQLQKRRSNDYVFPGSGEAGHLIEPRKQMRSVERQSVLYLNGVMTQKELETKSKESPESIVPGIEFTLHDLRRTFITVAESLDISYAALKKLLNHSDGNDVTGGYLQITTDRLRDPIERISTKLMELMNLPIVEGQIFQEPKSKPVA
jgi:integrase